jgi:hypothetical protein
LDTLNAQVTVPGLFFKMLEYGAAKEAVLATTNEFGKPMGLMLNWPETTPTEDELDSLTMVRPLREAAPELKSLKYTVVS